MAKGLHWASKAPIFLVFLALFCGCLGESERAIRQKLTIILKDDLDTIVMEVREKSADAVSESPHFVLTTFEEHNHSRLFTYRAVVEYFYLSKIKMKQVRKYRYEPTMGQWQRYHKAVEYNLNS